MIRITRKFIRVWAILLIFTLLFNDLISAETVHFDEVEFEFFLGQDEISAEADRLNFGIISPTGLSYSRLIRRHSQTNVHHSPTIAHPDSSGLVTGSRSVPYRGEYEIVDGWSFELYRTHPGTIVNSTVTYPFEWIGSPVRLLNDDGTVAFSIQTGERFYIEARWNVGPFDDPMGVTWTWTDSNGIPVLPTIHSGNEQRWHALTSQTRSFDPLWIRKDPLERYLGDSVDWIAELLASWGHTTTNLIPTLGRIVPTSLIGGTDSVLSSDGSIFDGIGVRTHSYLVEDTHAITLLDETFTTGDRDIIVRTQVAPLLVIKYASIARDKEGNLINDEIYTETGDTLSGGEDGWTNQPLDITLGTSGLGGAYDNLLQIQNEPDITATAPTFAVRTNYQEAALDPDIGTRVQGVLTDIGNPSLVLSPEMERHMKIDIVPPIASYQHQGGWNFVDTSIDDLSGVSPRVGGRAPSRIAFVLTGQPVTDADYEEFDVITPRGTGVYDIYMWVTDRAGNETKRLVELGVFLGGEVVANKTTDEGATLHVAECPNSLSIEREVSCDPACVTGTGVQREEGSSLTYRITLQNLDANNSASGAFEDYLPLGVVIDENEPPVAVQGSVTAPLAYEELSDGRWKVTGSYSDLEAGTDIFITIKCIVSGYDSATEIISNQATVTWEIVQKGIPLTGENKSNHAVHQVTAIPRVETIFTKVGADDVLSTRLVGAEFALYRWASDTPPTQAQREYIVDTELLIDNAGNTLGGDWVRVKYGGEVATSTSDVFVSVASPQGEVDFGMLEAGVYTLIETKAPLGYELPIGQWVLTVNPSNTDMGAGDWKIEFEGKSPSIMPPAAIRDESTPQDPTYQIINARPFSIGMSGLGGIRGRLLAGFIIMVLAGNAYITSIYKQSQKKK